MVSQYRKSGTSYSMGNYYRKSDGGDSLSSIRRREEDERRKFGEERERKRKELIEASTKREQAEKKSQLYETVSSNKITDFISNAASKVIGFFKKHKTPIEAIKDEDVRKAVKKVPEFAKEIAFEYPARAAGSLQMEARRARGEKDVFTPESKAEKFVFGEEPVKSFTRKGQEASKWIEQTTGIKTPSLAMGYAAVGLGALDVVTGGRGSVATRLVKAKTPSMVKKILGKSAKKYSDDVIKQVAKAKNKVEIDSILKRSGEGMSDVEIAFQRSPYRKRLKSVQESLGRELKIDEIRQLEDMSARNVGVDEFRKFYKKLGKATKTIEKEDLSRKSLVLSAKEFKTKQDFLKSKSIGAEDLAKKAKKYNSADEFVKAQGIPVYHGGKKVLSPEDFRDAIKSTYADERGALFTSSDKQVTGMFGKEITELYPQLKNPLVIDAKKNNYYDIPIPKELRKDFHSSMKTADTDSFVEIAQERGHDGVIIKNVIEGAGEYDPSDVRNVIIGLKKDSFKTKSQLTDIWNKTNKAEGLTSKNQKELAKIYQESKELTPRKEIALLRETNKINKAQDEFLKKTLGISKKTDESAVSKYRESLKNIDEIEVMSGKKLKDTLKISYGKDNYVAAAITKQDISKIKNDYKGKISDRWIKPKSIKGIKEKAKLPAKIYELPQILFKRTGLKKYVYDPIRNIGERKAKKQLVDITNRFKDAGLYKEGGWFTTDRFNLSKTEGENIGKYFLTRQGKDFGVIYKDLSKKEKKFVKLFDDTIKETEPQFRKVAKLNNENVASLTNYAPIATSKDLKLMDRKGEMDFMLKHPAFSALKGRKKFVPKDMYELDYRKVAAKWLNGITTFNNVGEISPQIKLLTESKEFKKVVGNEMADTTNQWLKSVLNPDIPKGAAGRAGFGAAKFLRKTAAVASLGLNYAPIIKQVLTQVPLTICEKAPPKLRSKFAKSFGIKVSELPSIAERKGTIAIADMQGKISKIFTGGLTQFDKKNAQYSLNRLLDKNWKKYLKAHNLKKGEELSDTAKDFIIKKSQDTLDLWYGGMTKAQLPPVFRSEIGKLLNMFIYPLTSQLNGFYYHQFKAKGFIGNTKAAAETAAAATGIAYMEQVISNLSPDWDNKQGMTEDVLKSVAGNIPMVSQVVYAIDAEQPLQISAGVSGISSFLKEYGKFKEAEDKDIKTLTLKGAEILGLPKQFRKTAEGVEVVGEGGVRSKQEKLLAPVKGKMGKVRALLKGKYGALEAKKYVENVGKRVERPIFDKGLEMIKAGNYNEAQRYVDSLLDEDYEEYKKGKTSYKRDNTIRVEGLLEYAPKKAIEYVRSLPEMEAQRIVDNLDDSQWEIYKSNM